MARFQIDGYKLDRGYDRALIESDEYRHWTVGDLIEMLKEYPQDARVWIEPKQGFIRPIEIVGGYDGNIHLG